MEENLNFELLSKQELRNLTDEQRIKAKEYYNEQKEYLENLKSGKDYQSGLDYSVQDDIRDYEERIQIVDDSNEMKK